MKENITYEVCPHCGEEVELPNTLGVHTCPHCGKAIVSCSMCTAVNSNDGVNYCATCCLCKIADDKNKIDETDSNIYFDDLFSIIGDSITPLHDLPYCGENGNGTALSFAIINKAQKQIVVTYEVAGYIFQDNDVISAFSSEFIDDVFKEVTEKNEKYMKLQSLAYKPSTLEKGSLNPTLYFDEFYFNEEFLDSIEFIPTTNNRVKIYCHDGFGGDTVEEINFTQFSMVDINTMISIFDTVSISDYTFKGETKVIINSITTSGRTKHEALASAKERIEHDLTKYGNLYGSIDSQVDQDDIEIY